MLCITYLSLRLTSGWRGAVGVEDIKRCQVRISGRVLPGIHDVTIDITQNGLAMTASMCIAYHLRVIFLSFFAVKAASLHPKR